MVTFLVRSTTSFSAQSVFWLRMRSLFECCHIHSRPVACTLCFELIAPSYDFVIFFLCHFDYTTTSPWVLSLSLSLLPLKTQRCCISQCSSFTWIPSRVTTAKPLIVLLQYYWSYHHLISVLAWVPLEESSGHELGQNPGYGEGQGGLACCSPWGQRVWHDWSNNNGRVFYTNIQLHADLFVF